MDVTSTALLVGLRDPSNRTVWSDFIQRFRPLIVAHARRLGVPTDDSEDVAQEALAAFAAAYRRGDYRRERGRLSSWLFGIATNSVRAWARRSRRIAAERPGLSAVDEPAARDALQLQWDREWRAATLRACLRQIALEVHPATLAAFRGFALEGRPAEDVAAGLGLTTNAVFGAKRRVLARLRELIPLVDDA